MSSCKALALFRNTWLPWLFLFVRAPECAAQLSVPQRVQKVVKEFTVQTGQEVIGLGSWTGAGTNYKLGVSDHDMRLVVPRKATESAEEYSARCAKEWVESRETLRTMLKREFGDQAGLVLKKTNLYAPSELVTHVRNADDAADVFQFFNSVPTLSHQGKVDRATAKQFSEGLWGEGSKAWTQHYEATKGTHFYSHNNKPYTGAADLVHLGEGQGKFTTYGKSNTALQWLDHADDALSEGGAKSLAKHLDRVADDLKKARDLSRVPQNSQFAADIRKTVARLKNVGDDGIDHALRSQVDDLIRRGRMEANLLKRLDDATPAERELLDLVLKDVRSEGTIARRLKNAAKKVPLGKLLDGVMIYWALSTGMETAGDRSIAEAVAKSVPELAGLTSLVLVEITDACLESAKEAGATFLANRQDAIDLLEGTYTVPGREQGEFGRSFSWDTIVGERGIHNERGLRGFVENRCREAASRDGVELAQGDKFVADALFARLYPVIRRTWLQKRHGYVKEFIRLNNQLRTARMVVEYSPDPVVLPEDGSPVRVRLRIVFPDINTGEILARMKQIARILAGPTATLYDGGRFSVKGSSGESSYEQYILVSRPGTISVQAMFMTDFIGGQLNWDSAVITKRLQKFSSVHIEVRGGRQEEVTPEDNEIVQDDGEGDAGTDVRIVSARDTKHTHVGEGESQESAASTGPGSGLRAGQVLATVSGNWEGTVDRFDEPRVEPAIEVPCGGTLKIAVKVSPPAPRRWSLGNSSTGVTVLFSRKLGNDYGVAQTVASAAGRPDESEYEATGSWQGAGRLTVICVSARGSGPLTGGQFEQSYSGQVVVTDVDRESSALVGDRLLPGEQLCTSARGEAVLSLGQNKILVGPNTQLRLKSDDTGRGRVMELAAGELRYRNKSLPPVSEYHRLTMQLTLGHQAANARGPVSHHALRLIPLGTDFRVRADQADGNGRMDVYDGSVVVEEDDEHVTVVRAGEHMEVTSGGEPSISRLELDFESVPVPAIDDTPIDDLPEDNRWPVPYGEIETVFSPERPLGEWEWIDPKGDATLDAREPRILQITVPDDNEFWGDRTRGPRLLHPVTGDFDVEAVLKLDCEGKDNAMWHWVVYSPGSHIGVHAKQFKMETGGVDYRILASGWTVQLGLTKAPVYGRSRLHDWPDLNGQPIHIRATRRGDLFKTYWSTDGIRWTLSSRTRLQLPETIRVGAALQRQAYDRRTDAAAVFTVSALTLRSAELRSMEVPRWDFVQCDGAIEADEDTLTLAVPKGKTGTVIAISGEPRTGDLDAKASFYTPDFPADAGTVYSLDLFAANEDESDYMYANRHHDDRWTNRFATDLKVDNGWYRGYKYLPATTNQGGLRIVRLGNRWEGHVREGSEWRRLDEEFTAGFDDPVYIGVRLDKQRETTVNKLFTATVKLQVSRGATPRAPAPSTHQPVAADVPDTGPADSQPRSPGLVSNPLPSHAGTDQAPSRTIPERLLSTIGIGVLPQTREAEQVLGIAGGAAVVGIRPNSVASRADIQRGDVIVRVNEQPVKGPEHLEQLLARQFAATHGKVLLQILRPTTKVSLRVAIALPRVGHPSGPGGAGHGPPLSSPLPTPPVPPPVVPPPVVPPPVDPPPWSRPYFGVNVRNVSDAEARQLGVRARWGAVLTRIYPNSPAEKAGMRAGDVIFGCDGMRVANLEALSAMINASRPGNRHVIDLLRGNATLRVQLRLETWPRSYR